MSVRGSGSPQDEVTCVAPAAVGKMWESQIPEGEEDLLKRCRAAAAGRSYLNWQCTAIFCAAGPVESWLLPEPSVGAQLGGSWLKGEVSSRKSHLLSGVAVEVVPLPTSAI